jgi:hypothetical protein
MRWCSADEHANDGAAALVVASLIQGRRRRIRVSKASKAASPEAAFFVGDPTSRTRDEPQGAKRLALRVISRGESR